MRSCAMVACTSSAFTCIAALLTTDPLATCIARHDGSSLVAIARDDLPARLE